MNRSTTMGLPCHYNLVSYQQRVAHHEAGHATAIHLNNSLNKLPPVYFQIIFENIDEGFVDSKLPSQVVKNRCIARVKDGRLIQSLIHVIDNPDIELSKCIEPIQSPITNDYRSAFETDIVNLLVGPLAEAKFSHQIDDELFNERLITPQALKNYGGYRDFAVVNDYLQSYSLNYQHQHEILNRLFFQAFNFVNDNANWKAITRLANYILTCNKNRISCEDVAIVLGST